MTIDRPFRKIKNIFESPKRNSLPKLLSASTHRLLLLKLDKQISSTIYQSNLAANKGKHLEGVGAILEGVGCLIGCRLPPLDAYVSMCLVLTIDVYAQLYSNANAANLELIS